MEEAEVAPSERLTEPEGLDDMNRNQLNAFIDENNVPGGKGGTNDAKIKRIRDFIAAENAKFDRAKTEAEGEPEVESRGRLTDEQIKSIEEKEAEIRLRERDIETSRKEIEREKSEVFTQSAERWIESNETKIQQLRDEIDAIRRQQRQKKNLAVV